MVLWRGLYQTMLVDGPLHHSNRTKRIWIKWRMAVTSAPGNSQNDSSSSSQSDLCTMFSLVFQSPYPSWFQWHRESKYFSSNGLRHYKWKDSKPSWYSWIWNNAPFILFLLWGWNRYWSIQRDISSLDIWGQETSSSLFRLHLLSRCPNVRIFILVQNLID